jgi:hypothetical protein
MNSKFVILRLDRGIHNTLKRMDSRLGRVAEETRLHGNDSASVLLHEEKGSYFTFLAFYLTFLAFLSGVKFLACGALF